MATPDPWAEFQPADSTTKSADQWAEFTPAPKVEPYKGKRLADGSADVMKPSGEGDLNVLRGKDVATGAGHNLARLGSGMLSSLKDSANDLTKHELSLPNNPNSILNNPLINPAASMLSVDKAALGMGSGMLSQVNRYGGKAEDAMKRGDVLDAATRAGQAGLSAIPGVSQAVQAADTDKPLGEGIGSGAVDILLQLLGTKTAGDIGGAALEKAKIPFLLKAPKARYASMIPESAETKAILERNPEVIDDMIANKVQGSAGAIQKKQAALAQGREVDQAQAEANAGAKATPLDPVLNDIKYGKNQLINKAGTAIDPRYVNSANKMQRLVSELADPLAHVGQNTGGPGHPSVVMKPGMSMEDLQALVQDTPDVYRNRSVGGAFDRMLRDPVQGAPLSAPFGEAVDLRKSLDEMNNRAYTRMTTPPSELQARIDAADALRKQLAETDPAYGEAAGKHHLALSGKTLTEAIKPADLFSQRGLRLAVGKTARSAVGGAVIGGVPGVVAGALADSILNSPMWKSMSAVKQLELAQALRTSLPGKGLMLSGDIVPPDEDPIEAHLKRRGL